MLRALTTRKRFGFGYGEDEDSKPGSMAIFCALCAQPGINLLESTFWKIGDSMRIGASIDIVI